MKLLTRHALLFSVVICLCVLSMAQDNKAQDGPPPLPPIEHKQENWIVFSPPERGYSISFPGTPERAKEQVQPFLGEFSQSFYYLNTGITDYKAGYFDLMAEVKDSTSGKVILDAERIHMLEANKNFKLLSEREFKTDDIEGRVNQRR